MHYRQLGRSGCSVSEIGIGCNRLGEPDRPDAHWIALVHRAAELGVTLFDTCEAYGWGRSEEILGAALGNDPNVLIADKVSRVRETDEKDFSAGRIMQRVELSLQRLQRDRIDILQLHSPSLAQLQSYDWPEAMARLKQQGKIGLAGVSINDAPSGEWLIAHELVDMLQMSYNVLEPEVGDALFALAQEAGVGVLVRVPMAQGILTGKFSPGEAVPPGHRALMAGARMQPRIQRAEALKPLADSAGMPLATLALRYAITPPAVSAAIPGARTIEQLEQNVAASNGHGLGPEIIDQIAVLRDA
ncbi:MAG: aldo/keto reductase [Anaerolineae bacterium]|nr:aldo/keto reductase [Anaerolineae bacterium]